MIASAPQPGSTGADLADKPSFGDNRRRDTVPVQPAVGGDIENRVCTGGDLHHGDTRQAPPPPPRPWHKKC